MSERIGSRHDHQRFCQIEGWTEVRNARGKSTQHHITYELPLGDGRILRTRISRPANPQACGRSLWSHILDDQLQVTVDEFWDCVDTRQAPRRLRETSEPVGALLPAGLAYRLVTTLHMATEEIQALSLEEAVRLATEHRNQTPP